MMVKAPSTCFCDVEKRGKNMKLGNPENWMNHLEDLPRKMEQPEPFFFLTKCMILGGGFKYFLFSPLFGEDSHFDSYFSDGWFNH